MEHRVLENKTNKPIVISVILEPGDFMTVKNEEAKRLLTPNAPLGETTRRPIIGDPPEDSSLSNSGTMPKMEVTHDTEL